MEAGAGGGSGEGTGGGSGTGGTGELVVSGVERLALGDLPRAPSTQARRAGAHGWRWVADYARVRTAKGRYVASIVLRAATGESATVTRRAVAYWRTKGDGAYVFQGAYRWRTDSRTGSCVEPAIVLDAKGFSAELDRQTQWVDSEAVGGLRYGPDIERSPSALMTRAGTDNENDEESSMSENTIGVGR